MANCRRDIRDPHRTLSLRERLAAPRLGRTSNRFGQPAANLSRSERATLQRPSAAERNACVTPRGFVRMEDRNRQSGRSLGEGSFPGPRPSCLSESRMKPLVRSLFFAAVAAGLVLPQVLAQGGRQQLGGAENQ